MNENDEILLNQIRLEMLNTQRALENITPIYNVVKRKKLSLELELKALNDRYQTLKEGQIDFITSAEF